MREVDHIIIHCSATLPKPSLNASDIDRWHRHNGWLGNGYHVVLPTDGRIEVETNGDRCRPLDKSGAHVGDCGPGWNKRSIGICLIGGIDEDGEPDFNYTPAQLHALHTIVEALLVLYPKAKVMGHRDLIEQTGASPKACPCFDVATEFPNWG